MDVNSLRIIIESRIAYFEGNAFQDFCDRLASELYPNDYHPVRPGGSRGDTKNDGYCPKVRVFFAAHATRGETAKRTKDKIEADLRGCLQNHRDVKTWRYLTNDTLTGEVDQYIDNELRPAYPDVTIEVWGHKRLAIEIAKLRSSQIEHILQISLPGDVSHRRIDFLLEEAELCKGRLATRWLATGISEDIIAELVEDQEIGEWRKFQADFPDDRLVFIVGDYGSGKSITALRLHAHNIRNALADATAEIPVFLSAQEIGSSLTQTLRAVTADFAESRANGIRLIIDGLEEPGLGTAARLIEQIRTFAYSNPKNRVIVTTRPGPELTGGKIFKHPVLSEEAAGDLAERLGGHRSMVWSESAALREMLRLPLFTIIAATRRQGGNEIPRSRGAFLAALAQEVLGPPTPPSMDTESLLKEIARLSMHFGGSVPIAELEHGQSLARALATRFVIKKRNSVFFALPVLEQYFAARSVLEEGFSDADLENLALMDRWRYALLLAVTVGSWRQTNTLLERLVDKVPGLASWLIKNAIPSADMDPDVALPEELECARRIRSSLAAWTSVFEDIADAFSFTDDDGKLNTFGTLVDGPCLYVGFKQGSAETGVRRLPQDSRLLGRDPIDGSVWSPLKMTHVSADFMAWPWQLALDLVSSDLEGLLRSKIFPIHHCDAYLAERRWALCKALMNGQGNVLHKPLAGDELLEKATTLASRMAGSQAEGFIIGGFRKFIGTKEELSSFIEWCTAQGEQLIRRPYVAPDLVGHESGFKDGLYSYEALRLLAEQVFTKALQIYKALVETFFPRLIPTLGLGCILPVALRGILWAEKGAIPDPWLHLTMEPLPVSEESYAEVSPERHGLKQWDRDNFQEEHIRVMRMIADIHPGAERWAHPRFASMAIRVFGDMPATAQAYRWLWEDLKQLCLIDGLPSYGDD